jgi:hypothetical protein
MNSIKIEMETLSMNDPLQRNDLQVVIISWKHMLQTSRQIGVEANLPSSQRRWTDPKSFSNLMARAVFLLLERCGHEMTAQAKQSMTTHLKICRALMMPANAASDELWESIPSSVGEFWNPQLGLCLWVNDSFTDVLGVIEIVRQHINRIAIRTPIRGDGRWFLGAFNRHWSEMSQAPFYAVVSKSAVAFFTKCGFAQMRDHSCPVISKLMNATPDGKDVAMVLNTPAQIARWEACSLNDDESFKMPTGTSLSIQHGMAEDLCYLIENLGDLGKTCKADKIKALINKVGGIEKMMSLITSKLNL